MFNYIIIIMAGIVKITFKDAIGSEPIRAELPTSMTLFDLYEKVAHVTGRKISKLVIQMSGSYMSTELVKSRDQTIQSISGAFIRNSHGGNEITLFVIYDERGGSSRKRRRTKRRKTNKKRRTNRRK
jgi:hypothetical protein